MLTYFFDRRSDLVVRVGGPRFDSMPRQTKVFKTGSSGFYVNSTASVRIMDLLSTGLKKKKI